MKPFRPTVVLQKCHEALIIGVRVVGLALNNVSPSNASKKSAFDGEIS